MVPSLRRGNADLSLDTLKTVAIAKAMNQVKVHICERNLKAYLFTLVMVFFDPRSKEQKDVS